MTAVIDEKIQVAARIGTCMTIKGWTDFDQCGALYRAARDAKADGANLEVGCYLGRSTVAICRGLEDRKMGDTLVVIDCFEADETDTQLASEFAAYSRPAHDIFLDNMKRAGASPLLIVGRSDDPTARDMAGTRFRFAHLDGDHTYANVAEELKWLVPLMADGGVIALDDYDVHEPVWGVKRAYEEFCKPHVRREWFSKMDDHALFAEIAKED